MTGYATPLRNAKLDANTTFIGNAGKLDIYDGTPPATGGAITTQNKLAEFVTGTPFAPASSGGVQSPNLPSATTGITNGTATWARQWKADGTTFCMDRLVGVSGSGAPIILNTTTITTGIACTVTSWTITNND
jgi:hypothetical protein